MKGGQATSFDCISTLVTYRRMFETHPSVTEQDFAQWTRIGGAFQAERKHVQRHKAERTQLAKGL